MASSPPPYANSKPSTWSSPSLICLIGAACASILLFTYYRIVKQIWYRHHGASFSRNWVGRQLLDEANPDDPSLQFHSRGLDSSTVYSLPIAQFKKNEGPSHSNTDCAVCLGEFEEGELLKHLPNCSHAFHIPCIDTWFESHSNCPLCRSYVNDLTMDNELSGSMNTSLETQGGKISFKKGQNIIKSFGLRSYRRPHIDKTQKMAIDLFHPVEYNPIERGKMRTYYLG